MFITNKKTEIGVCGKKLVLGTACAQIGILCSLFKVHEKSAFQMFSASFLVNLSFCQIALLRCWRKAVLLLVLRDFPHDGFLHLWHQFFQSRTGPTGKKQQWMPISPLVDEADFLRASFWREVRLLLLLETASCFSFPEIHFHIDFSKSKHTQTHTHIHKYTLTHLLGKAGKEFDKEAGLFFFCFFFLFCCFSFCFIYLFYLFIYFIFLSTTRWTCACVRACATAPKIW